ncbi:MAG: hypothetical protein ABI548_23045 [Polyangiaceae bacterium]
MISSTTGARTNGRICRRLVIGITLLSGSVHAANSPPFALEYAADLSCPDAPAFSELVRAKLGPTAAPSAASAVPRVLVRLHATPSGFSGRLELHRLDASEYSREVSGGTCSEVANAIAFVLALALGAKDTAPEVAAAPEPPPPPAPTPVPVPPLPSPPAPVVAEQKASPSELSATRAAPSRIGDLGVGVQFGARTGSARYGRPLARRSWRCADCARLRSRSRYVARLWTDKP